MSRSEAENLKNHMDLAAELIDSGKAMEILEKLIRFSQE